MVRLLRHLAVCALALALAGCHIAPCPDDENSILYAFMYAIGLCGFVDETAAKGGVDFDAYRIVHQQVLPQSVGGPELAALLAQFRDEAVSLTLADVTLAATGQNVAMQWSARTRAFVDGLGIEANVTQAMADSLDAHLDRLATNASPGLASAIAVERAARPPLQSLVGLNMDAFRAAVLPLDRVFRDEFE